MEVETLHSKAKEVCTKLVTVCRTLSQAVESRCPEEKLVDHIRTVAMSALNVSSTITSHVEARDQELREKAELQENFLADYDKSLRENIVSLVRHTRDFYANPLDYMTQQALNNCLKEVAVNVKSLVEAARALDEIDGLGEAQVLDSPVKAEKETSGAEKDDTDNATTAEQADTIGNAVSEQSEVLIKNMDVISDAIPEKDAKAFEKAQSIIKSALESINSALQGIPNTETALSGLQDATSSYVTAAKAFFKSPDSEAYAKKYTDSQKDFSVSLKQLLFQVTRRNRLVGRSLSRGFSKRSLTQNLRNSVMSGAASRLVRDGSGRSLNAGSSDSSDKPASPEKSDATKPSEKTLEKPHKDDLPPSSKSPRKDDTKLKSDHSKSELASPATKSSSTPRSTPTKGVSTTDVKSAADSPADSPAHPTLTKEDRQSSKVVVTTTDSPKSKTDVESPSTTKKRDKKEKEKSKDKRDKEKSKDKKQKGDLSDSLSSSKDKRSGKSVATLASGQGGSPAGVVSANRGTLTASSSSAGGVTASQTPNQSPLKHRFSSRDELSQSEESPQVARLKQTRDMAASSDSEGEASRDGGSPASSLSLSTSIGTTSSSLNFPPKRESMRRINSSELLGEIEHRQQRQEEAIKRPYDDTDSSIIDDSRDEDDEEEKAPVGRIRAAASVSQGSGGAAPVVIQTAPSTPGKRTADNDKQQIANRIIQSFCERFPGFKAEWEGADPMKKVLTENKIVSELAMYQITLLQTHPAPGGTPNGPDGSPQAVTPLILPPAGSSAPVGTQSLKMMKASGKDKAKSLATIPGEKKPKKTNTPASLRLWSDDKDKTSPTKDLSSSSSGKDRSPRSAANAAAAAAAGAGSGGPDDNAQLDAELQRIAAMKTPADLGGMTMRLKGGIRSLIGRMPSQKPSSTSIVPVAAKLPENTAETSQTFCATLLDFLQEVQECLRDPSTYEGTKCDELVESEKGLLGLLRTLLGGLRVLVGIPSGTPTGQSVLSDLLNRIEDETNNVREGVLDEIDSRLINECQYAKLARDNLERAIFRWCSGMYYTTAQIGTDFSALVKLNEMDPEAEATVMHVLALIGAFFNLLTLLMNDLITLHYVVTNSADNSRSIAPSPRFSLSSGGAPLWSEPEPEPTNEKDVGPFRTGNFNQLIIRLLTQPNDRFTESFMDTYTSFTTSSQLLDKLYEAVMQLPKDKFDKQKTIKILSVVCDVIGRLIRNGARYDFDDQCVPKIRKLLGELAKTIDIGIQVQQLIVLVKNTEEEEKNREPIYQDVPKEVQIFEGDCLPHAFLLSFDATTIAQQLTHIEFEIYKSITADELKNQSWNKPKRMCIARNVCALIQRANRISMWVATAILLQPKVKDRARVILKVINVAKALRELGNYNTLMGIIAGLNMSCVSRLRQTMATVGRKPLDTLKVLQNIVDPTSSFKTLRETLRQGGPTQLPYIGTTLTDLTFIEDGNPDNFNHPTTHKDVINMEKRDLLANCIRSVRAYQTSDYKITLKDPPHTFLHELPCLDEHLLYALSLEREPRTNETFRKNR
jgi:hypothetical protein